LFPSYSTKFTELKHLLSTNCVKCSHTIEDDMHIFLGCASVVNCWKEENLWYRTKNQLQSTESFAATIFTILAGLDK